MHWPMDFVGPRRGGVKIYCVPVCPTVSERAEEGGDLTPRREVAMGGEGDRTTKYGNDGKRGRSLGLDSKD